MCQGRYTFVFAHLGQDEIELEIIFSMWIIWRVNSLQVNGEMQVR